MFKPKSSDFPPSSRESSRTMTINLNQSASDAVEKEAEKADLTDGGLMAQMICHCLRKLGHEVTEKAYMRRVHYGDGEDSSAQ